MYKNINFITTDFQTDFSWKIRITITTNNESNNKAALY